MKKNTRINYFLLIFTVIILGVLSRRIHGVPLFFGDILYAIMVYFGIRFVFINSSFRNSIILALLLCFSIEFLQLYTAEWMVSIRKTTLGHYVFGQGFLWSDLVYYTLGVVFAFLADVFLINKK
ncbi:DUF2809 domain-containing protein [Flavobacterium sp.]|uniref:ribosomal maturation YjgA family protein n=1 Tax=Flavobacterium sp. TaxID=239 RepID=UPI00286B1E37|nr:DUF2809 domain-containing protein [Flavobacterium sp.]